MKLRAFIQSTLFIYLLVTAVLVAVFVYFFREIQDEGKEQVAAQQIVLQVFELNILVSQYLETGEPMFSDKLDSHYAELTALLQGGIFDEPDEQETAAFISQRLERLYENSQAILESETRSGGSGRNSESTQRLLLESHTLVANALQLAELNQIELLAAQRVTIVLVIMVILVVAVVLLGNAVINDRLIIAPLLQLTSAMQQADLRKAASPPVEIQTANEIGDLAAAFNRLSADLTDTYAQLEEKNRDLSENIGQIEEKNLLLEDTKRAMINMLEDLAEEKATLAKEKVRDEAVLESVGDGLVATDNDTRIILVNDAFEHLLGVTAKDVIGKPVTSVITALDEHLRPIPFEKRSHPIALFTGKPVTTRNIFYSRKDGSAMPVAVTVTPVILNKEIIGAVEVFRDITKEKEIDQAKNEFVSLASHQLRTPLSTIGWYVEMLLSGDAGKVNAEQKQYLEEIASGNEQMIDLVNSLLNVSRLELGTFMIDPKPSDLREICESVLKELIPNIKKKQLKVNTSYADFGTLELDPGLMRIVMQNLLSNAVKYTPRKGTVTLEVAKKGTTIRITVTDTGIGIPKAQQKKIFSKLFRADNVHEIDADGTGLGLYIVKSIMDASGGSVSFTSVQNKGTTFVITLPATGMARKEGTKPLQ
jgi:PAS domain S-box-containing protein